MKKSIKYWICFHHHELDLSSKQIFIPSPDIDPESITFEEDAYAFGIYQQTNVIDEEGNVYKGKVTGGLLYYHPDTKIETVDNARKLLADDGDLMRCLDSWTTIHNVIITRFNRGLLEFGFKDFKILKGE